MKNSQKTSAGGVLGSLSRAFALASTGTILLMMLTILVGFFFRAWRLSLSGVTEATEFLVLIGVFLGFAYVQHKDTHIKAELFTPIFPLRLRRVVGILSTLLALLFFAAVLHGGIISVAESFAVGEYEVGLRSVPVWMVRAFVPIGSIAVVLVCIGDLIKRITILIKKEKREFSGR